MNAPVVPTPGLGIRQSTVLQPGAYVLPAGLTIAADGITLDGNGAVLVGVNRQGAGVQVDGHAGVTIRNLRIRDYYHGLVVRNCQNVTLEHNQISATAEVPVNTVFLDIWRPAADAYGGAILLDHVAGGEINDNNLQHQMSGLLLYHCRRLNVRRNNASYKSGFGVYLHDTSDSVLEENWADFCCRYEPRDTPRPVVGAGSTGHMGADAAGFVIEHNRFLRNGTAIAILADRDHGIRPVPPEVSGRPELRPCDNVIRGNDIQDNRTGIHLANADRTVIEQNTINKNVEADLRREDDRDTRLGHNLGLRGAYL